MPLTSKKKNLSQLEIDERAAVATDFLNNKVIQEIFDDMRSRQVGILYEADVGSLTASTAHAMLRAIEALRGELESVITDKKMHEKFHRGGPHE